MSAPHAPNRVHVRVPGKINVYMNVGERQPDGYHDVATAYQAVSLYEDVRATHASDVTVSFEGTTDVSAVPLGESNLAVRAARLLARRTGHQGGVRLEIQKRIPVSGGMGGGSADAAGALLACDILWGTGVGREELGRLAADLGADVPFALAGGTAIGTGRGDRLSPALAKGTFHWVLVPNDIGLSTPEVYGALDRHREQHAADIAPVAQAPAVDDGILQALRAGDPDLLAAHLHNDLQVAALKDRPDLAETLEVGESAGALAGIVSGSGPTVAFLARDADAARALLVDLSAAGYDARHVTGPVAGARQVD